MDEAYSGYLAGLNYTRGFYRELSPHILAIACLGRDRQGLAQGGRFTYCELGCGQGLSTCVLAAANPRAEFYATDINPEHISWAKELSASCDVRNVHYFEESFGEFSDNPAIPKFDFIALHGIYSWVGDAQRSEIKQFLLRKLNGGGVTYISYNASPAALAESALREVIINVGNEVFDSVPVRISKSLDFITRMRDVAPAFLAANPGLSSRLDQLQKDDPIYVAHEYLNRSWRPLYHHELASEMGQARLSYVGSASLLDNLPALNLTLAQQGFVEAVSAEPWRETLTDYMANRRFRRDVFGRGLTSLNSPEIEAAWANRGFVLVVQPDDAALTLQRSVRVELRAEIYIPVIEALAMGPATVEELLQHTEVRKLGTAALREVLLVLVGAGYAEPCLTTDGIEDRVASTRRFNSAVMERARLSNEIEVLASPVTGSGITVSRFDQLFLSALNSRDDPSESAWLALHACGQKILKQGKPLESAEENRVELRERFLKFERSVLPILKRTGIAG